jgi:hypothetical protein
MPAPLDLAALPRTVERFRRFRATESSGLERSCLSVTLLQQAGNTAVVGLVDAPPHADPQRSPGHPLTQANHTSTPTSGEADRWKG